MQIQRSFKRSIGFTLIELLVVIAIIGILAAMLLPTLAKAKSQAQGVQCMNNTHQMVMAWKLYADDNQDKIPAGSPTRDSTPVWSAGDYLTLNSPHDPNNWDADTYIKKSCLWSYCGKSAAIWRCPSDTSTAINSTGQVVPRIRSISMNCWVGGPVWPADPGFKAYHSTSDMIDPGPSMTFVFLDERQDSINAGYFVVDMQGFPQQATILGDYPASYHLGSAGIAFADGHSEIHQWKDPRTTPPISDVDMPLGIPSAGNPDVYWMQERSTRK